MTHRRSIPLLTALLAGLLAGLLIALAAVPPDAGARAKRSLRGIDVSRFQGHIAWRQVGKTQIRFAYVQATRGSGRDCAVAPETCGADPYFKRNYRRAKDVGIKVGVYHRAFASGPGPKAARRDARAEARLFARTVRKVRKRDLRPALDVEHPFVRLRERSLRVWIRTWLRVVQRRLRVKPIIYTNYSSWQATGDTRAFARNGYRLWVANFDVRRPLVPARNWAGRGWSIWQFTSSGRVRGIDGNVDKNRLSRGFRGLRAR